MSDPRGSTWTYAYDENNNLIKTTDPLGQYTEMAYDSNGKVTAQTDANGHTASYTYDALGQLLSVTDPLGNTTSYTYDANGNQLTIIDPQGRITTNTYDGANRLTAITYSDNTTESYTLDANGNILTKTDPNNNLTTYEYDGLNRITRIIDAVGAVTQYQYDNIGNKIKEIDADNNETSYTYDSLNRLIQTTDPLNKTIQVQYDVVGNIIAKTDANGNTTAYTYDALGNLHTVTDVLNNVTTYQYDPNKNLVKVTDAKSKERTFAYDALNRQTKETEPSGTEKLKTYDAVGNLISRTKADGQQISYTYDVNNRLTQITYPDNSQVTYTYSPVGIRTSMTDSHGTTAYTYDSRDRLQTVTRNGSTISYAYDAAGNLTELTYPDGTVLNYTNNSLNLPITATEMTNTLNVSYDNCGRRNSETIPNDINVTYQYDANGRLTLVRHQLAETVLAQTGYTLDNNGNRLSIQDEQSRQTNFTYDDLNQLIQAAYPDNTIIDYLYDAVGNRRTMTGNIPADLDNTNAGYQYDYEDRLTSVTDAEKTINYIYDGDGNLIGKTITTGTTTETYEYIYDYSAGLPRVLVEKKNGTEIFDYFYLGRLYARKGSEGTIYYHQDGLGSTLATTDAGGNVLNKYTYDAFGTPKVIQETVANSILFTGEPYDASGLYYLRARYYDPATGRFITQDTLFGEMDNPLTQNLYVYCGNNPVLYVDPSGHVRRCTNEQDDNDLMNLLISRESASGDRIGEGIWSLKSDGAGRTILFWYLYMRGTDFIVKDGYYGDYMMKNDVLQMKVRNLILPYGNGLNNNESIKIDLATSMEIQNGEDIIGYQYLHGTNKYAGGFTIKGDITKSNKGDTTYNLTYTWNDIIDPNLIYDSDNKKAQLAKSIPGAAPTDYKISISWRDKTVIKASPSRFNWSKGWLSK